MHSNFNPHTPMIMGGNQFGMISDEQLLEQLRHMSTYGTHNQTTLMLLHELHLRAARSFGKTFVPTKEVHGDAFLYTSIFKNGVMTHFFVVEKETKQKIDEIFERTKVENTFEDEFSAERIGLLLELGDVFNVISVNEQGKHIGGVNRRGFASLFVSKGFNEESRHSSKALPLAVVEVSTLAVLNSDPKHLANQLMQDATQVIRDNDILIQLGNYLSNTRVIKEYGDAVAARLRDNALGAGPSLPTQIHLFPADGSAPVKLLGGLTDNWTAGFIKREQYPHLFPNPAMYASPGGMLGGFNAFGAGKGPWA